MLRVITRSIVAAVLWSIRQYESCIQHVYNFIVRLSGSISCSQLGSRLFNNYCYIASAKTKRDWMIYGHVALDKCNVSLGQQVNNCYPLRPAAYINKQNGGETCKSINSDFRAFCLKKYTINREDMLLKLKFYYSSKFWLF